MSTIYKVVVGNDHSYAEIAVSADDVAARDAMIAEFCAASTREEFDACATSDNGLTMDDCEYSVHSIAEVGDDDLDDQIMTVYEGNTAVPFTYRDVRGVVIIDSGSC